MTDPTVEAYKKFRPVDETETKSNDTSDPADPSENWDSVATALSNAIPNSAAGLLIHHRMIAHYLQSANRASDRQPANQSTLHKLIDGHTRSLAAGARQLRATG